MPVAVSAMATKLVANSSIEPMNTGMFHVARPIADDRERRHQRRRDGDPDDRLAAATDDREGARQRREYSATSRSNRLGRVRARISAVGAFSGDASTISAVNRTATAAPPASATDDRRTSAKSNVARPKPRPRIGLISGEISIAPMTTAGDDSSSPSTAMPGGHQRHEDEARRPAAVILDARDDGGVVDARDQRRTHRGKQPAHPQRRHGPVVGGVGYGQSGSLIVPV